jgi:hypothetical protein
MAIVTTPAYADIPLTVNASVVRLQNFEPDFVVVSFTGSTCTNGSLVFPSTATAGDRNRLWATVLAAKLSNRNIFFGYDNTSVPGSCIITNFGVA